MPYGSFFVTNSGKYACNYLAVGFLNNTVFQNEKSEHTIKTFKIVAPLLWLYVSASFAISCSAPPGCRIDSVGVFVSSPKEYSLASSD